MPDEPVPAGTFMMDKLLGEITSCKMFPVKLSGMKHQERLSTMTKLIHPNLCLKYIQIYRCITPIIPQGNTMQTHAEDLEASYFQIKNLLPKSKAWSHS